MHIFDFVKKLFLYSKPNDGLRGLHPVKDPVSGACFTSLSSSNRCIVKVSAPTVCSSTRRRLSPLYGQALLQFSSIDTPDTLEVALSAYNKVPYFGQFIVKSVPVPYGNAEDLLIGPNPVDENGILHLMFELEADQEVDISIYNNIGQLWQNHRENYQVKK